MKIRRTLFPSEVLSCALLVLVSAPPAAAQNHSAASSAVYAIKGAKIFTLAGAPIDNGTVVIRDGKIAAVGVTVQIPAHAKIIDASGLLVYPGMFDAATQIGLEEVPAVKATMDTVETGLFNPDVTAATAFNADSAHVDVTRAAGITEVLTVPGSLGGGGGGSIIGGNASAVDLGGWNINDMAIRRHAAMELTWPSISRRSRSIACHSPKLKSSISKRLTSSRICSTRLVTTCRPCKAARRISRAI
jgi:imidazolonepropionase-like amidohydrolase